MGVLPINKEDVHRDQVKLTRDGIVIDHHKQDGVSGLISVLGVKYTTARVVAQQAVDLAVNKLGRKTRQCQTHSKPVKGGYVTDFRSLLNRAMSEVSHDSDEEVVQHLVYTYGSEYNRFETYDLSHRIDRALPVTEAEVIHAVRDEMALTVADVIQRRTELGATGLPSMNTLQKCADLMGRELSWTFERQQREIDSVVQAYPFKQMERVTS